MSNPESDSIPLERRNELGSFTAALHTIRDVLLRPHELFARPAREQSLIPPLLLALVIQLPVGLALGVVQTSRQLLHPIPGFTAPPAMVAVQFVVGQALGFVLYPVGAAVVAGLQWLVLFAVGARDAPYREVLRAVFYLHAVGLIYVVLSPLALLLEVIGPGIGMVVFLIYLFAAFGYSAVALAKVEKTGLGRVLAAQGLLMSVCCCLPMIAAMALGGFGAYMASR